VIEGNSSQKIGLSTATIIGMNAMIGAGIFALPAVLANHVGPAGILAFIFVTASVWFIAQSLARVAKRFPQEGSFYTYTKQWAGHTLGIISSGTYLFGILVAKGLLVQKAGEFARYFVPQFSANTLGTIILAIIVILNVLGIKMSQLGQRILIICTVIPILTIIALCLTKIDFNLLTPFAPYGFANVLDATRVVIFGFFGFECATSLFNCVKNPEKNIPKALTYSIFLVGALYTLFIGAIILSTPLNLFAIKELPEVLKMTLPEYPWIVTIINVSILSAIIGTIHSMVWASGCLLLSLFKKMTRPTFKKLLSTNIINRKTSIILSGLVIYVSFLVIKKQDLFFSLAAIFIVFSYLTSIVTLLFIKEEWKSRQNIKTVIGIATASMIFIFAAQDLIQEVAKIFN